MHDVINTIVQCQIDLLYAATEKAKSKDFKTAKKILKMYRKFDKKRKMLIQKQQKQRE